jgi:hypothetical protein
MASVAPVAPQISPDPLQSAAAILASSPDPASAATNIPQPASVAAFNALISGGSTTPTSTSGTAGVLGDIFGSSANATGEVAEDMAPLLRIPGDFHYSKGTFNAIDQLFPSLPNSVPSPMELFTAQVQISQIQLAWQLTGKMIGTSVQGVNTLVNSQV